MRLGKLLVLSAFLSILIPLWLWRSALSRSVEEEKWKGLELSAVTPDDGATDPSPLLPDLVEDLDAKDEACAPIAWPNPFSHAALSVLYDGLSAPLSMQDILPLWHESDGRLRSWIAEEPLSQNSLPCDGLEVTALGMDFSGVQARRYGAQTQSGNELQSDEDVSEIRQMYFDTPVHNFFFEVDYSIYFRRPLPFPPNYLTAREAKMIQDFRRDGYVRVDIFDGLDLATLKYNSRFRPMLLDDSLMRKLAHGYIGADTQYHGKNYLAVPAEASKAQYEDSQWHHDGCGQRLQAVVFLHDVNESTHPTSIINGTHRFQWYPPTHFSSEPTLKRPRIRLNADLVLSEFRHHAIVKMYGKRGGGFIFDTNSLHSATLGPGQQAREVVIFDIAALEHMAHMPRETSAKEKKMVVIPPYTCPRSVYGERVLWPFPGTPMRSSDDKLRVDGARYIDDRRRRR